MKVGRRSVRAGFLVSSESAFDHICAAYPAMKRIAALAAAIAKCSLTQCDVSSHATMPL